MPKNPERAYRGGDVSGTTETNNEWGVGEGVEVADASFDPGYEIGESLDVATMADVKQGYASYGISVGDSRRKGYVGGR
jgi:hypothetical protein